MRSNDNILFKPPLFFANYNAEERIIINQGGTSSGKTYTILDVLFTIGMSQPNLRITVVGQDIPNLKSGAYRDAKDIRSRSEEYKIWYPYINETDRIIRCISGSFIEFKSYSDEQDAKSGKRDYLFVNEADGIPYNIYWQLAERTYKKIFIDYNPTARFWVHDALIGKPNVKLIISDHRHNPFLKREDHERIESYTGERFKVYSRGLTGKMEGLVYDDWSLVDEMPIEYKRRWIGLDFGFTNDPTAIIDVRLSNGELWIDEMVYEVGLVNTIPKNGAEKKSIERRLKENKIDRTFCIVADSQEIKSISELYNVGFNIESAKKGPDSIKNGIDILRRYHLNVTRRSKNVRMELGSYEWAKDKSGKTTNKPIDEMNHALDAIRYVALNKLCEHRPTKRPRAKTMTLS